jgi:hypothetical protein
MDSRRVLSNESAQMEGQAMDKSKSGAGALAAIIREQYSVCNVQPVRPTVRDTVSGIAQSLLMLCASALGAVAILSAIVAK